jgi:AcrR family transcriptional regulator
MASTGPTPNQRELAATDARNRILAAAAECLVRDGLANVRMAGIAKAAGVSAGLLHYHFDTKEKLFAEVLVYCHGISSDLSRQAMHGAEGRPALRLASFLDRCLPSDQQLADEWLLWDELALLCIRKPELAKVGEELYDDLYNTVETIIGDGVRSGAFQPAVEPRMVAETAVALCDGLGARVLANDPDLTLEGARTIIATTVGVLVGHDGPLPHPTELLVEAKA